MLERRIRARLQQLPFGVALVLPGGRRLGPERAPLVLRLHELGLLRPLASGQIGRLAQAHVDGRLDIDGSPRLVADLAGALLQSDPVAAGLSRPWAPWLQGLRVAGTHSRRRDREQVQFHYDLGDEFYELWLDPRRVYSCAYYREPGLSLAQAQEAKLELICRKLMLRPGLRLLDIGAGWGALMLWAVEHHGAIAHGVTLSRHQHDHVQRLIEERGLRDRASIELRDYRDIVEEDPGYDRIASVGMFEHVGRVQLDAYFTKLRRLLRPGGLLLNHGITAAGLHNRQLGAGIGDFVERHIFPGGELVHVAQVMEAMARAGFEVLDVENLRPHYARTLWDWSDALEARLDAARALVPEPVLRAWRLYLAGSALGFERCWMGLHQLLGWRPEARGAQSQYPFTRDHIYR
ncbi:class I SAM-dependent methyltransferase [Rivibacter subsaxonicus]|nr:class I SAM-dependent methyltransferase [Rivibacter subsaxonicus]